MTTTTVIIMKRAVAMIMMMTTMTTTTMATTTTLIMTTVMIMNIKRRYSQTWTFLRVTNELLNRRAQSPAVTSPMSRRGPGTAPPPYADTSGTRDSTWLEPSPRAVVTMDGAREFITAHFLETWPFATLPTPLGNRIVTRPMSFPFTTPTGFAAFCEIRPVSVPAGDRARLEVAVKVLFVAPEARTVLASEPRSWVRAESSPGSRAISARPRALAESRPARVAAADWTRVLVTMPRFRSRSKTRTSRPSIARLRIRAISISKLGTITTGLRTMREVTPGRISTVYRTVVCITEFYLNREAETRAISPSVFWSWIGTVSRPLHCAISTRFRTVAETRPSRVATVNGTRKNITRPHFHCWPKTGTVESSVSRKRVCTVAASPPGSISTSLRTNREITPRRVSTVDWTRMNVAAFYLNFGSELRAVSSAIFWRRVTAISSSLCAPLPAGFRTVAEIRPVRVASMYGARKAVASLLLYRCAETRTVSPAELRWRIRAVTSPYRFSVPAAFGANTKRRPRAITTIDRTRVCVALPQFFSQTETRTVFPAKSRTGVGTRSGSSARAVTTRLGTDREVRPVWVASLNRTRVYVTLYDLQSRTKTRAVFPSKARYRIRAISCSLHRSVTACLRTLTKLRPGGVLSINGATLRVAALTLHIRPKATAALSSVLRLGIRASATSPSSAVPTR